ncbi:hypothetical protein WJX77_003119 [Trebouxia sp. C0004]
MQSVQATAGAFQSQDASQIHCSGAGLVFLPSPDLSVTTQESYFAVFKGRLDNYPYLVRKYCVRHLQQDSTPTLNQIKEAAPLTAAEVVCELYQTLGTSFLPKLKGDFAFLCFDSQKVRVLATRASAGGVSLWQARGPDACLCIGSGDCEPAGSHSKLDIQPGYFKYGWYAEPQRFITPVPESTTNAAASAAQKAMHGISMTPKPATSDTKRYSSSSGADMSSQSTDFMYRSSSMTASAPIAIGSKDSSNDDSLVSSMYTDTVMDGSVTSDATSKTNKTRRGKRGGKKQRENSQIRRMQSVPQSVSPMLASSPSGSQADRKDWWRSSASDKDMSPLRQAANSQGDAMSTVSLTDIPLARGLSGPARASAIDPALLPGHADAAWGSQDTSEGTDDLLFRLSLAFSQGGSRLPTVVEHMEEGMSRPQSLADLSKAGWTVDSILSRCSSQANITRMARISSFPELGTMPEGTLSSGSPVPAFPEYPSQQQLADLGTQMSAAFFGLSSASKPSQVAFKSVSMLNPLATSFEPSQSQAQHEQLAAASDPSGAVAQGEIVGFVSSLEASTSLRDNAWQATGAAHESAGRITHAPQSDAVMLGGGMIEERADKAVARRLLLKKRTPSFNKSKSCNDLVSVGPKSPTRSPFAPLANFAQ